MKTPVKTDMTNILFEISIAIDTNFC